MVTVRRIHVSPSLVNSSCAWASELDQLQELFDCPHTGAVTTRTATLTGFNESIQKKVAFTKDTITSFNSYGYSPHPLSCYIEYIDTILTSAPPDSTKPFIISITSSSPISLASMLDSIQEMRAKFNDAEGPTSRIAVELNTSCPNIKGSPPPSYNFPCLTPILDVLADYFWKDRTLVLGLKLPPYVYSTQFDDLVKAIAAYSRAHPHPADRAARLNPFAFFTSTNTLGSTLLFADQMRDADEPPAKPALPAGVAALAGESLHPLALGNVYTLAQLLREHEDAAMREIAIVGVGGVTTKAAHRRMRRAGAAVVACATLLGREGVRAFELVAIEDEGVKSGSVAEKGGGEN